MSAASMGMQLLAALRNERMRQNLSKSEVARRIGADRAKFSRMEDGYTMPSFDRLVRWASCLGITIRAEKDTVL